jgi:hypothetical protein
MRAHRRFLAALFAAVTLALPAATAAAAGSMTATAACPYGTAWDNVQHRCI